MISKIIVSIMTLIQLAVITAIAVSFNVNGFVIAIIVIIVIAATIKRMRRPQRSSSSGRSASSSHSYIPSSVYYCSDTNNDYMIQEQNRLFQEQVQQEQLQRDMYEATRCSMNDSYNAMSDANYACTGIDSFGHNPF